MPYLSGAKALCGRVYYLFWPNVATKTFTDHHHQPASASNHSCPVPLVHGPIRAASVTGRKLSGFLCPRNSIQFSLFLLFILWQPGAAW